MSDHHDTDWLLEELGATMELSGQQVRPAALLLLAEDLAHIESLCCVWPWPASALSIVARSSPAPCCSTWTTPWAACCRQKPTAWR